MTDTDDLAAPPMFMDGAAFGAPPPIFIDGAAFRAPPPMFMDGAAFGGPPPPSDTGCAPVKGLKGVSEGAEGPDEGRLSGWKPCIVRGYA